MRTFQYTVKALTGLHARPAALLFKQASTYRSRIRIEYDGRSANAKNIIEIFNLKANQGAEVLFSIEGEDEEKAAGELKEFCKKYL